MWAKKTYSGTKLCKFYFNSLFNLSIAIVSTGDIIKTKEQLIRGVKWDFYVEKKPFPYILGKADISTHIAK